MVEHVRFAADQQRRMITGLVVEWGTVARTGGRLWRFAEDSLHWSAVGKIKMNTEHERTQLVGVAQALSSTARGLYGEFRIARTPEGDRALSMASDGILDGLSVEVAFEDGDVYGPDRYDPSVTFVERGTLRGVALVGHPAFDDARVTSVAASRDTRLELRLDGEEAAGVRAAAERAGVSMSELARTAMRAYTSQRPVYSFTGQGASFVRDAWAVRHPSDSADPGEAQRRLTAFQNWQREARDSVQFATTTTSTASQIVEPAYGPLLSSWEQDRPLFAAASKANISDATAFNLPAQVVDSGVDSAVGTQTEGTNRADNAAMTFTPVTVSPTGIVGLFRATRELVDSSNPAIDAVALAVMRESFGRQTEARIFTELNTVQTGTITAGLVPSGAMARVSAGTALPADLRKTILAFMNTRGMRPRSVVASSRTSVSDALELLDGSTVPAGSDDFFVVNGCGVRLSPQISGVASTDGDVFALGTGDLWAWSSPLVEFQYYERQGPAMVDLSIFGYFGARVVNPRGLASIRHT